MLNPSRSGLHAKRRNERSARRVTSTQTAAVGTTAAVSTVVQERKATKTRRPVARTRQTRNARFPKKSKSERSVFLGIINPALISLSDSRFQRYAIRSWILALVRCSANVKKRLTGHGCWRMPYLPLPVSLFGHHGRFPSTHVVLNHSAHIVLVPSNADALHFLGH